MKNSKQNMDITNELKITLQSINKINGYTKQYEGWSMNLNQLIVLIESAIYPTKSLGEITEAVGISQPTMWRTIEKFEKRGLGKKVQDTFDHRTHYFKLSPKAKKLLKSV